MRTLTLGAEIILMTIFIEINTSKAKILIVESFKISINECCLLKEICIRGEMSAWPIYFGMKSVIEEGIYKIMTENVKIPHTGSKYKRKGAQEQIV
jgi:hypothetical protein